MKEIACVFIDKNIQLNVESWIGRGNIFLVLKISVDHLRDDKFNQKCKSSNFVIKC